MLKGRVKRFDHSTGSGLIEQENGGPDVAVHFSAVTSKSQRTLQESQYVQFKISGDAGDLRATDVEILQESHQSVAQPSVGGTSTPPVASAPAQTNRKRGASAAHQSRFKKVLLWPLGVGVVGALLFALHSNPRQNSPQPVAAPELKSRSLPVTSKPQFAPPKPMPVMDGEKFSQTRLWQISAEEANRLTPNQLQYAISEMYARHGFAFGRRSQRKQFAQLSWYKPIAGKTQSASWQQFSEIEKRNARLLDQVKTARQAQQLQQARVAQAYQAEQQQLARQSQQERVTQQQAALAWQNEPHAETQPEITRPQTPVSSSLARDPDSGSSGDVTATGLPIFTGPRGGRFHYSASGKKVYERRR